MWMLVLGVMLTLVGMGGAVNACTADTDEQLVAVPFISGLSLAMGLALVAVVAARHGYHRRPLGAPPGDMDPEKVSDPAPDKW